MNGLRGSQLFPYCLRFGRPLQTARGRFEQRTGWLLRLQDRDGHFGWGDAAPWPGFGASAQEVERALLDVLPGLPELCIETLEHLEAWLQAAALPAPAAYAVELALLDLLAQRSGQPLRELFADKPRARVASHVLVADAAEAQAAVAAGARTLKLKLGGQDPWPRVASVRAAVGWDVALRLDVNGGWQLPAALRYAQALEELRPDWLEQPVVGLDALGSLRQQTAIPIAADECLAEHDVTAVLPAADVLVLKPMFVGGLLAARRIARKGLAAGKRVALTHALESAVGRTGTLQLAAALPGLEVGGLAGGPVEDVCVAPRMLSGWLALPASLGLGVRPALPLQVSRRPLGPSGSAPLERARPPDPFALPHPLRSAVLARPGLVFARGAHFELTAAALLERAACLAAGLAGQGVRPGDCVALPLPSQDTGAADWLRAFFAVSWLGAVAAPLASDPGSWPQALASLHPKALLVAGSPRPRLAGLCAERGILQLHGTPCATPLPERFWPLAEERLRLLSSGSSGQPHAVRLRTGQLAFSAFGSSIRLGHRPDDLWLACLPMHHVGGLAILLRCAFYAVGLHWLPRFDAAEVGRLLDSGEISLVSLVPTMLSRLLDARPAAPFPARLRAILLGGAAAPHALLHRCRELGIPVATTWGMSESASQLATRLPWDTREHADVGAPLAFARVTSYGGRLHAAGPVVSGGLLSSDLGQIDAQGRVRITGRASDRMTSGGETFALAPIETTFRSHPAVRDCAALALPDPDWGQRLALALIPTAAHPPEDIELLAWARSRLPACQLPKELRWTRQFPRSPLGKLLRVELSALFRDAVTPEEKS